MDEKQKKLLEKKHKLSLFRRGYVVFSNTASYVKSDQFHETCGCDLHGGGRGESQEAVRGFKRSV